MNRPADTISIDELRLSLSEKSFQAEVRSEAVYHGWKVYAVWDSRKTPAGWPDLTLVRGTRLMFWELKKQKGRKPTDDQLAWLSALSETGAETAVYRPSDWETIVSRLE